MQPEKKKEHELSSVRHCLAMLNVGRIHNEYTNWQKVQTPCVYLKFNPPGKTVVSSSDLSLNYWCLHHCFPSISKDLFKKVMKSVLGIVEMCSEVHKGELLSQNSTCSRSKTTRFLVFDVIYQVIPVISWDVREVRMGEKMSNCTSASKGTCREEQLH